MTHLSLACLMNEVDDFERGRLHEKVQEHDRRLQAINGSIDKAQAAITQLSTEVTKITVRVAVATSIATLVGSGITAVVVAKLT
jgi:hypothetical protein